MGRAAPVALRDYSRSEIRPFLPAASLLILLAPGIALQSVGMSWTVFAGWLLGTAGGAYVGVAGGVLVRARAVGE